MTKEEQYYWWKGHEPGQYDTTGNIDGLFYNFTNCNDEKTVNNYMLMY